MKRIPSLDHSLFQARAALRTRLAALPSRPQHVGNAAPCEEELPRDTDILAVLLDTTATRNDDEASARREYARLCSSEVSGLPDYDDAQARGWFRTIAGRVCPAAGMREYYLRRDVPCADALRRYVRVLDAVTYRVARPGDHASAQGFEDHVGAGAVGLTPPIQTPAWVAARLWDASSTKDLATWAMRWELLDWVPFVPAEVWSPQAAQAFRQAALTALRDGALPSWNHPSMTAILRSGADVREAAAIELKADLLGRVLDRTDSMYGTDLFKADTLCAFMRILAVELAHVEAGPVPSPVAQELVALAMRHPDLCATLMDSCQKCPTLMADLVLCPEAAGLVCYMVATWHTRIQVAQEHRSDAADPVQSSLLSDCLEVLRSHLMQGAVAPAEYMRLLIVAHQHDCDEPAGMSLLPIGLNHLHSLPVTIKREVCRELVQATCSSANSLEFALMLKVASVVGQPFDAVQAQSVAAAYQKAFSAGSRADTRWIDAAGAAVLVQLALDNEALRPCIFQPLDVKAALQLRPGETVGLGLLMREHIRMLSRAVVGYPSTVPKALVDALAAAIRGGASDRADRGRVDAFTFQLDSSTSRRPGTRLEWDLVEAISRVQVPAQQECLVQALLLVEEPLVLALVLRRAPSAHHSGIRDRLRALTPDLASAPAFFTQSSERAQALLDAGLADVAAAFAQESEATLRGERRIDMAVRTLNLQLQIFYISGQYAAIDSATVPEGLRPEHQREAQRPLDFFKALTCLKATPPMARQAAATFRRLYQEVSLPGYAINLLAARVVELLGDNLFKSLTGDEAGKARLALEEADRAILSASAISDLSRAVHVPNCASVLLALGQPRLALARLAELAAAELSPESMAFEAIALARLGTPDRALAVMRACEERYGALDLVVAAKDHIDHAGGFGAAPLVVVKREASTEFRSAMKMFMELSVADQAEVLYGPHQALEQLLTSTFRDALGAFHRVLSFLKLDRHKDFEEDDYNGIVAELVEARLEGTLGWQAHGQSPGGYTSKGNAGRRDFALRRRGGDIAVFEALISTFPNDKRIVAHLHKLFGYSSASILFFVIYSRRPDTSEMWAAVKNVAKQPPPGTTYIDQWETSAEGSRPGALRAAYSRDGADVTVMFFVIDMVQTGQRAAVGAPPT